MKDKFLIPISIVIAGIIIAGAFVYLNQEKIQFFSKGQLSSQEAADKAIEYINKNKDSIAGGQTASLVNIVDEGEIYRIRLKVGETEYDSYITKDGKFLFPGGYNLEEGNQNITQETPSEVQTETPEEGNLSAAQLESLAKCLTGKGAKFYGAYWCPWCNKEKELFGDAAQYLPYIECSKQDSQEMTAECKAIGITSYPTWEFNGEKTTGFKTIEELTELSGCLI